MDRLIETDFKDMVKRLAKPGEAIVAQLTPEAAHLLHMALGVSGEVAELLLPAYNCVKGWKYDRDNLKEELGDLEFYLEGIYAPLGLGQFEHREDDSPLSAEDLISLVVEAGEVLDVIKKHAVYRKDLDLEKLVEALAEVQWILNRVREASDFSVEEVLSHNINKLSKGANPRYAGGVYSNEAAQLRADKA